MVPSRPRHHVGTPRSLYRGQAWRAKLADKVNQPAYYIINNKVLDGICATLPVTERGLLDIKGVGKVTVEKYGIDILGMVKHYTIKNRIRGNQHAGAPLAALPKSTTRNALELLQAGVSIEEVAERRKVNVEKVYDYVAGWVRQGKLDARSVMGLERYQTVRKFIGTSTLSEMGVLAERAGGQFSVGELRVALIAS